MPITSIGGLETGLGSTTAKAAETVSGADFKKMLFSEIDKVNQAQAESKVASEAAISGTSDSIHEMKVAGLKAELTLQFAVAVNNKAIEAYKELMRLQL